MGLLVGAEQNVVGICGTAIRRDDSEGLTAEPWTRTSGEHVIRAHAAELIAMAEDLGFVDLSSMLVHGCCLRSG